MGKVHWVTGRRNREGQIHSQSFRARTRPWRARLSLSLTSPWTAAGHRASPSCKGGWKCHLWLRSLQGFSVKSQIGNTFSIGGFMLSATITELCQWTEKLPWTTCE